MEFRIITGLVTKLPVQSFLKFSKNFTISALPVLFYVFSLMSMPMLSMSMSASMQLGHGHAAWTLTCILDIDMRHGHDMDVYIGMDMGLHRQGCEHGHGPT